ncbi:MAG TPA: hypothetical protein VNA04_06195 [Thermoanaerobaculia bacterium]|nr:hypothetical protein [Thermoanaerobaculia bacterium]
MSDLGDVQRLIEALHLPLDLAERLDLSVRDTSSGTVIAVAVT